MHATSEPEHFLSEYILLRIFSLHRYIDCTHPPPNNSLTVEKARGDTEGGQGDSGDVQETTRSWKQRYACTHHSFVPVAV